MRVTENKTLILNFHILIAELLSLTEATLRNPSPRLHSEPCLMMMVFSRWPRAPLLLILVFTIRGTVASYELPPVPNLNHAETEVIFAAGETGRPGAMGYFAGDPFRFPPSIEVDTHWTVEIDDLMWCKDLLTECDWDWVEPMPEIMPLNS